MQNISSKTPLFIIIFTILGSVIFTFAMKSSTDTWNNQKSDLNKLMALVGNISANTKNENELLRLKPKFDGFFGGSMISIEANDPELLKRMLLLRKDYENHLKGRFDYYQKDNKLNQSCNKLIKQLSAKIASEDSRNRYKMFIPMLIGLLILVVYFSINAYLKKSKKKIFKENLPQESIHEIKTLIGNGNTAKALDKLKVVLEKIKSPRLDDLLMIKSQFNNSQKDRNLNLIDANEESMTTSKTNKAILDLLNEMSS